jgi:hypothetical protein
VVHLFASRHEGPGFNPQGGTYVVALSRYIGDPDMIDHSGLIWGGRRPEPSLGRRADNVIILLDLTQLFCPGFTLAAGPPSGFTTDIVGCWGSPVESLQSHMILTMSHWSSGPPVCFPSWGTRVQSPGGYLCETKILLLALSRYITLLLFVDSKNFCFLNMSFVQVFRTCYTINTGVKNSALVL